MSGIPEDELHKMFVTVMEPLIDSVVYGICRNCDCLICMSLRLGDQTARKHEQAGDLESHVRGLMMLLRANGYA